MLNDKYLILKYPLYEISRAEMSDIYNSLIEKCKGKFTDILMIPYEYDLCELTLKDLKKIRDLIDKLIVESEG